jgi:hypothetical protein
LSAPRSFPAIIPFTIDATLPIAMLMLATRGRGVSLRRAR